MKIVYKPTVLDELKELWDNRDKNKQIDYIELTEIERICIDKEMIDYYPIYHNSTVDKIKKYLNINSDINIIINETYN